MVNGSRYYRALESFSTALALTTALTIYPCQIRVCQRWQYKLQLPTAQKKEWRPATADSSPQAVTCQHCDTHYLIVGLEPATFRLLVRRARYHIATDSSPHYLCMKKGANNTDLPTFEKVNWYPGPSVSAVYVYNIIRLRAYAWR